MVIRIVNTSSKMADAFIVIGTGAEVNLIACENKGKSVNL